MLFPVDKKNSFPLTEMKDWLKNMIQLKNELFRLTAVECRLRKWNKMGSTS